MTVADADASFSTEAARPGTGSTDGGDVRYQEEATFQLLSLTPRN